MRKSSRMLALLLPLLLTAAPASGQTAQIPIVRVELIPARTLPGIPVTVIVTLTNPGAQEMEIINQFHVLVTPRQGEPFYAIDDTTSSPRESFSLSPQLDSGSTLHPKVTLPPGETRTLVLPADLFSQPGFFIDERLSRPGTYRLRLKVWNGSADPPAPADSNEVTLTVADPQGPDAIVWKRMLELSQGQGWNFVDWITFGPAIAKETLTNAPSSGYTPYVAAFKWGQTAAEHREGIEYAISLRPEGPIADQLQGVLAGWYEERGEEALSNGDLERALEMFAEARRRAGEMNRTTTYPWIREQGERWLADELDSEPVLRGRFSENVRAMSGFPGPVKPFVECVDPGSSKSDPYIVWFGYHNQNSGAKLIAPGKGNGVTPGPAKELPRVFQPGRQKYGFSITTHAERVTWTLDGETATASRETQPRCTYPKLETLALRPVVDCIRTDGAETVISFGYENPNAVAFRIAAGDDNQLTGAKGQPPAIFEPGRHYDVFRVTVKSNETVRWRLAGKSASSASPSASVSCSHDRD